MSALTTALRQEVSRDGTAAPAAPATALEFHYNQSDSFAPLLRQLGASLLEKKKGTAYIHGL